MRGSREVVTPDRFRSPWLNELGRLRAARDDGPRNKSGVTMEG